VTQSRAISSRSPNRGLARRATLIFRLLENTFSMGFAAALHGSCRQYPEKTATPSGGRFFKSAFDNDVRCRETLCASNFVLIRNENGDAPPNRQYQN